jgi:hypothetical protein
MTEKQITRPDPYLAISELHILSFEIRCARRTPYILAKRLVPAKGIKPAAFIL